MTHIIRYPQAGQRGKSICGDADPKSAPRTSQSVMHSSWCLTAASFSQTL